MNDLSYLVNILGEMISNHAGWAISFLAFACAVTAIVATITDALKQRAPQQKPAVIHRHKSR